MQYEIDTRRLREFREARAWSVNDFAAASGISARTLQRIEAGQNASSDTLQGLASSLNVHPNMLRKYTVPKGVIAGLIGGYGGILIAMVSNVWVAFQGGLSGATLGAILGGLGACAGLIGGAAGWMISRDQRRFREGRVED